MTFTQIAARDRKLSYYLSVLGSTVQKQSPIANDNEHDHLTVTTDGTKYRQRVINHLSTCLSRGTLDEDIAILVGPLEAEGLSVSVYTVRNSKSVNKVTFGANLVTCVRDNFGRLTLI
jgi:hypothetical protein